MMNPVRSHLVFVVPVMSLFLIGLLSSSSSPVRAQNLTPEAVASPTPSAALPPAFVDRCLDVAEQLDTQFADELRLLCELDPVEFERIIRRTTGSPACRRQHNIGARGGGRAHN